MRRRLRGFTLIELLVTISIVAVLIGLIAAGIFSARAKADAVRCVGNLQQWGAALQLYIGDHQGETPRRGQGVQPVTIINRPEDWFNCLPPYMGKESYQAMAARGERIDRAHGGIFSCPSAVDGGASNFLPYAMNMYLSPWIRPDPHRVMELPNPQRLVFLADGPGGYSSTAPSRLGYSISARHSGNVNLCFVDGHVASVSGGYAGAGTGDPHRADILWETQSEGVNQAPLP